MGLGPPQVVCVLNSLRVTFCRACELASGGQHGQATALQRLQFQPVDRGNSRYPGDDRRMQAPSASWIASS
jgi:hypothetical protein